jgi:hypothetical protein
MTTPNKRNPINYVTSDLLFTYIDRIERYVKMDVFPRLVIAVDFDRSINTTTRQQIELMILGIRVYVRVLQGKYLRGDSNELQDENLDFFYQTPDTKDGINGRKFSELLKIGIKNDGSLNSAQYIDAVVNNIVSKIPILGQIAQLLDLLFDFTGAKQKRTKEFAESLKSLNLIFAEFMTEWQKEREKQFPTLNPSVIGGGNGGTSGTVGNSGTGGNTFTGGTNGNTGIGGNVGTGTNGTNNTLTPENPKNNSTLSTLLLVGVGLLALKKFSG